MQFHADPNKLLNECLPVLVGLTTQAHQIQSIDPDVSPTEEKDLVGVARKMPSAVSFGNPLGFR